MLTTILIVLATVGALLGLSGAALGNRAYRASRAATDDCRSLARRLAATTAGADPHAIRDIAIVRYDALEEMSGARSFSLALLNMDGEGIVLTSINGRSETRTYAKVVSTGPTADTLSPEEYRAVRAARLGHRVVGNDDARPAEHPTRETVHIGHETLRTR